MQISFCLTVRYHFFYIEAPCSPAPAGQGTFDPQDSIILFILIARYPAACYGVSARSWIQNMVEREKKDDDKDWEYGDAWKTGSPDDPVPEDTVEYVEVLRGDTGKGLSDTTMLEYVLYLGERGIAATFDAYPLEQIKTYVLKVEAGKEDEAIRYLAERARSEKE